MPTGPRSERRPADVIGAAVMVAKIATGEISETLPSKSGRTRSGAAGAAARTKKTHAREASPDRQEGGGGSVGLVMSKNKHRQQPIPNREVAPTHEASTPGSMLVQLGYDPKGPSEPIDIVSSKEGWSEYTLADGTVIRAKGVLLDVKRLVNQYNPEGDPIYVLQLTMVNQARVPDNLKKKG
jgi:hypothetical protein